MDGFRGKSGLRDRCISSNSKLATVRIAGCQSLIRQPVSTLMNAPTAGSLWAHVRQASSFGIAKDAPWCVAADSFVCEIAVTAELHCGVRASQ
jgi:DNA gyrase inhibitor GyrI